MLLLGANVHLIGQGQTFRLPRELNEASGLATWSEDTLIWINDSGDGPNIYLTNEEGKLYGAIYLDELRHKDWEDLSLDDKRRLFIGDVGNNCHCRRDLGIYIFDPRTADLDSIEFSFANQRDYPSRGKDRLFDLEAFFYYGDSLYLFTKGDLREKNFRTYLYVLPAKAGSYTVWPRDSLELGNRVVTGAAIRSDGKEAMLLAYRFGQGLGLFFLTKAEVWIFSEFEGDKFLRGKIRKLKLKPRWRPTQFEAIDYGKKDEIYVGSEALPFFKQRMKKIGTGKPGSD